MSELTFLDFVNAALKEPTVRSLKTPAEQALEYFDRSHKHQLNEILCVEEFVRRADISEEMRRRHLVFIAETRVRLDVITPHNLPDFDDIDAAVQAIYDDLLDNFGIDTKIWKLYNEVWLKWHPEYFLWRSVHDY